MESDGMPRVITMHDDVQYRQSTDNDVRVLCMNKHQKLS
jgi:hypothetical protein